MGDITQMFYQVRVLPSDRDALRFLWRFNENLPLDTYHINVHLLGKIDSPSCSNWDPRMTALDNFKKIRVPVVDDYLDSFDNLDKIIATIHVITNRFTNIRWFCITFESLSSKVVNLDFEKNYPQKER